ncbi:MAG: hypothetical protein AABW58_03470 [Nanoarchaeota archaeon]
MPKPKYTSDGLPVISPENIETYGKLYLRDLKRAGIEDVFKVFLEKLEKENHNLCTLLVSAIENRRALGFSDDYLTGLIIGARAVYEALRRQSAANKLEKEFEGK